MSTDHAEPTDRADVLKALTRRQQEAMAARLARGGHVVPQVEAAASLGISQSAYSRRLNGGIRKLGNRGYDVAPIRARLGLT